MKDGNGACSSAPQHTHRMADLLERCQAAREYDGFLRGSDGPQQLVVYQLERCDLVGGHAHLAQEGDRRRVEGRREELHAMTRGRALELRLPVPGCVGRPVELVERLAAPLFVGARNPEPSVVAVDRECVGRVRLKLDRVHARRACRLDEVDGAGEALVVVARELGDDERRMAGPDWAGADSKHARHVSPVRGLSHGRVGAQPLLGWACPNRVRPARSRTHPDRA